MNINQQYNYVQLFPRKLSNVGHQLPTPNFTSTRPAKKFVYVIPQQSTPSYIQNLSFQGKQNNINNNQRRTNFQYINPVQTYIQNNPGQVGIQRINHSPASKPIQPQISKSFTASSSKPQHDRFTSTGKDLNDAKSLLTNLEIELREQLSINNNLLFGIRQSRMGKQEIKHKVNKSFHVQRKTQEKDKEMFMNNLELDMQNTALKKQNESLQLEVKTLQNNQQQDQKQTAEFKGIIQQTKKKDTLITNEIKKFRDIVLKLENKVIPINYN